MFIVLIVLNMVLINNVFCFASYSLSSINITVCLNVLNHVIGFIQDISSLVRQSLEFNHTISFSDLQTEMKLRIKIDDHVLFGFVIVLTLPSGTLPICSQSSQSKEVASQSLSYTSRGDRVNSNSIHVRIGILTFSLQFLPPAKMGQLPNLLLLF